mmetsp:Transcript_19728/g.51356  ORF Transcript_19728/g.51356 Transcript_19728/m.51356 type:complete len:207 (-) Transcript_19728:1052-1672(-)
MASLVAVMTPLLDLYDRTRPRIPDARFGPSGTERRWADASCNPTGLPQMPSARTAGRGSARLKNLSSVVELGQVAITTSAWFGHPRKTRTAMGKRRPPQRHQRPPQLHRPLCPRPLPHARATVSLMAEAGTGRQRVVSLRDGPHLWSSTRSRAAATLRSTSLAMCSELPAITPSRVPPGRQAWPFAPCTLNGTFHRPATAQSAGIA